MATHSSILAWRIPWTEELGRLQLGSWRIRHEWAHTHQHSLISGYHRVHSCLHLPSGPMSLLWSLMSYNVWQTLCWGCCYSLAPAAAAAKSLQSCPTLCNPIDGSLPGSSIPGILQARTLEWVAISFSNAWKWKWSRSVVSDSLGPHELQPTGLLHGIFQARVLQWAAIAFSEPGT